MKRLLICYISFAVALCIALLAGVYAYRETYVLTNDELSFESFSQNGNRLTIRVKSKTEGEYVYRLITSDLENGKLTVTLRGGKQSSLAQEPGRNVAEFEIELPEGTKKVVCGKTTIYTVK
ncbi:MAG: hypothetical protein J1E00_00090 [Oscillospiraceae bacterium]|nr:hypothetical protein [Oscillospiraceae bacterium]